MRLIDADKLQKAIPAEEDNITGMGMTYDEMEAYNDGIDEQWKKIINAPTIQPEPHWIPCSERLPEVNDTYLVSYEDASVLMDWFNGYWFFYQTNPAVEEIGTVVAWMPRPEPYQSKEESE